MGGAHDKGLRASDFLLTESLVRVLSPQGKVSLTFTALERAVLTCELSRMDFPASWYKDGQKVEESASLVVKVDGHKHYLVLPAAQVRDSGEFECRTEGVSAFFSVTVQGQEPWQPGFLPPRRPLWGWGPFQGGPGGRGDVFQITVHLLLNPPMSKRTGQPHALCCVRVWGTAFK